MSSLGLTTGREKPGGMLHWHFPQATCPSWCQTHSVITRPVLKCEKDEIQGLKLKGLKPGF